MSIRQWYSEHNRHLRIGLSSVWKEKVLPSCKSHLQLAQTDRPSVLLRETPEPADPSSIMGSLDGHGDTNKRI